MDHDKTLVTKWFNSKLRINDDISKLGNDLFQEACVFVAKSAKEQTLEFDRKVTPRNLIEALEGVDSEKWKSALDKELTSLSDRNCFSICSTDDQDDKSKRAIKSKLCFRIKVNPDRTFRCKIRLVACGYSQRYGSDYKITYSPTAQWKSITTILHLAAVFDWQIIG